VDPEDLETVVAAIKESRKYRDTSEETIRELAAEALKQHRKPKPAIKAVRKRLHSIMAPYLGDPDYAIAINRLKEAFGSADDEQVRAVCWDILHCHLSTRERLPIMERFYSEIFHVTGRPKRILDVACGLNPLAFPWMGLEVPLDYYAYDIHEPRIQFLNQYFALQGLPQFARLQDIALRFPDEPADIAFFLKEMPRFERNYGNLGRPLLEALLVRHVVLSFPTVSSHGGRDLTERYRAFFYELIEEKPWSFTELLFEGELVFCVDKHGQSPEASRDNSHGSGV